jgi:hypothetical protein
VLYISYFLSKYPLKKSGNFWEYSFFFLSIITAYGQAGNLNYKRTDSIHILSIIYCEPADEISFVVFVGLLEVNCNPDGTLTCFLHSYFLAILVGADLRVCPKHAGFLQPSCIYIEKSITIRISNGL